MCLGVPARVVKILQEDGWAMVDTMGLKSKVSIQMLSQVLPGDYLMIHAGYAIEKIDLAEARERIRLWEELLDYESINSIP